MKLSTSLVAFGILAAATAAFGTPSGLNNIPTADTVGDHTVALQAYDTFGNGGENVFAAGFKAGLDFLPLKFEIGLDSQLSHPAGPLDFQFKAAISPWEKGQFAVGVANVGLTNQDRAGDPFTYAVFTQDFDIARLSVGYGLQTHNDSVLIGLDRTWKIFGEHDLMLCADVVQTNDQSGWLTAPGFKYEICKNVIFETWANLPDHGHASYLVKLNYVFKF
jgi:hypothetical protein